MYYEMPFFFRTLLRGEHLYRQPSLEESIRQHAVVLLMSGKGEWRFDPEFGCELWDMNFETDPETRRRLQNLEHSIRLLLEKYEPRLSRPEVKITPDDQIREFFDPKGSVQLFPQKRLSVLISGLLAADGRRVQLPPVELAYRPR